MRNRRLGLIAAGLVLGTLLWMGADALEPAADPVLAWNKASGTVEVSGLSRSQLRHPELLTVHPHTSIAEDAPSMLGTREVAGDRVVFRPRFPLVAGLRYTARFQTGDAQWIEASFVPPARSSAATVVSHVYPTSDEIPANQLKFYIELSQPMSVGEAYEHVRLLDGAGREVPRAFLEVSQELWDSRRQRFTLIVDPGRIKRGLKSNLEDGPPLREGGRYRLAIGSGWRDGEGKPLRASFEKSFRVVAADRIAPDPRTWQWTQPAANTTEPLRLRLGEPLDHALLAEMIDVVDADGESVDGHVEIAEAETQWLFRPNDPWRKSGYSLRVNTKLEDRAGNNLQRLFDEEVRRSPDITPPWIDLPFTTR